jgi:hypothetical protein
MKPQDIIEAIAVLDGFLINGTFNDEPLFFKEHKGVTWQYLPPYLTSRDAIVPVIEKNYPDKIAASLVQVLQNSPGCNRVTNAWIMTATPSQLCEALLRATGKWID